jgi:hypothetical protein
LKGHKSEAVFFKDTSNYFSLLNLRSLIERFGSPRILWEGEREIFFKYVKAEMNTIQDTEKYMSGVLNNLLRTHCLNNFMKENQFFQESSVSKTREFKVYSNCKEFINNFATGKIHSAVLIKLQPDDEIVYVCYEDKDKNWFSWKKSDSKMKMDAQDSISIMRLYRYLKKP